MHDFISQNDELGAIGTYSDVTFRKNTFLATAHTAIYIQ